MKKGRTTILLALFATASLWSSSPVVSKIVLRTLDPFTVAFFRFAIASIILLPFFIKEQKKVKKFELKLIPILLLATFNVGFFTTGINYTISNASVIIYTATPLITAFLSFAFLKERVAPLRLVGIVIGLIGVLLVLILPAISANQQFTGNLLGNVLIFIAVWTWAGYTAGSGYLSKRKNYPPIYLTALSFFIGTPLFFITMITTVSPENIIKAFEPQAFLLLLYLGFFITVATYFAYQWIIKHSSANIASLQTYMLPPVGFFLAWILLGDNLRIEHIAGTVIVFVGVFLATSEKKKTSTEPPVEM